VRLGRLEGEGKILGEKGRANGPGNIGKRRIRRRRGGSKGVSSDAQSIFYFLQKRGVRLPGKWRQGYEGKKIEDHEAY